MLRPPRNLLKSKQKSQTLPRQPWCWAPPLWQKHGGPCSLFLSPWHLVEAERRAPFVRIACVAIRLSSSTVTTVSTPQQESGWLRRRRQRRMPVVVSLLRQLGSWTNFRLNWSVTDPTRVARCGLAGLIQPIRTELFRSGRSWIRREPSRRFLSRAISLARVCASLCADCIVGVGLIPPEQHFYTAPAMFVYSGPFQPEPSCTR